MASNFVTNLMAAVGNQFPVQKKTNKTVTAYNERIQRAREKVKKDEYITASDLRSKRYDVAGEKKLTKPELKAAGVRPNDEGVTERQLPSTAINRIRYNPSTGDLYVQFRNGKKKDYLFPHVDKHTVQQFLTAGSKGKYYWRRVRPFRVSAAEAIAIAAKNKNK